MNSRTWSCGAALTLGLAAFAASGCDSAEEATDDASAASTSAGSDTSGAGTSTAGTSSGAAGSTTDDGASVPSGTADDGAVDDSAVDDGASTPGSMTDDAAPDDGATDDAVDDGSLDDAAPDDVMTVDDGPLDDGAADDGMTDDTMTVDDGPLDDGSLDDAMTVDDGPLDDGATDDSATDDGALDDGALDDGAPDDAVDDGVTDDGMTDDAAADDGVDPAELEPFSFFVTSYEAIERLSGSPDGFGGDLRYGEAHGLLGADKICSEVAEYSMPGSAAKQWHAFLSVSEGPEGGQVDAIDRIGEGPWYDRNGRVVAESIEALQNTRPEGAHPEIINDLPNEYGVPNHAPDPLAGEIDNHHVLTGSNEEGRLYGPTAHCNNWSSTEKSADGRPRIGFSWPAGNRQHWISGQDEGGCLRGVDLDGGGGSNPDVGTVGSGGGYGGIYCFALSP